MEDRILTLHPDPNKSGVNIDRDNYRVIRDAILHTIREQGEIAFGELPEAVREQVGNSFSGSIRWYVATIKLDLEARNLIERVPHRTPQYLRLCQG